MISVVPLKAVSSPLFVRAQRMSNLIQLTLQRHYVQSVTYRMDWRNMEVYHQVCKRSDTIWLDCRFIEWTSEIREGKLTIYRLEICSTGPEVTFSLIICEDFSWNVSYRRQKIHKEFCRRLTNVPSEINTGIL